MRSDGYSNHVRERNPDPRVPAAPIVCLFFMSGVSRLINEVVWFKRLSVIWDSSTLTSSAITAAFILGLSVGAWLMGYFKCDIRGRDSFVDSLPTMTLGLCVPPHAG